MSRSGPFTHRRLSYRLRRKGVTHHAASWNTARHPPAPFRTRPTECREELTGLSIVVAVFEQHLTGALGDDLLIGAVPPAAISDWRYLGVSLFAGIVTFLRPSIIDRLRSPVLLFDTAGLGRLYG
jgi:hypothetical protein